MKAPQDIILEPVVSEASLGDVKLKKYTFRVAKDANKIEIGEAVEELFPGTQVKKVCTVHMRGRLKRMGKNSGLTTSWKKAIVTLTDKSKGIEFFESML